MTVHAQESVPLGVVEGNDGASRACCAAAWGLGLWAEVQLVSVLKISLRAHGFGSLGSWGLDLRL